MLWDPTRLMMQVDWMHRMWPGMGCKPKMAAPQRRRGLAGARSQWPELREAPRQQPHDFVGKDEPGLGLFWETVLSGLGELVVASVNGEKWVLWGCSGMGSADPLGGSLDLNCGRTGAQS